MSVQTCDACLHYDRASYEHPCSICSVQIARHPEPYDSHWTPVPSCDSCTHDATDINHADSPCRGCLNFGHFEAAAWTPQHSDAIPPEAVDYEEAYPTGTVDDLGRYPNDGGRS